MSSALLPQSDSPVPFTFRLWTPEQNEQEERDDEREAMGALTLREAFRQYVLPSLILDKAAPATIKAYENALDHWERLMPANPRLRDLDDEVMMKFQSVCDKKPTTANKWFRHLRAVLNRMGPRVNHDKRSRRNKQYFHEVPYLEDLKEGKESRDKRRPIQLKDPVVNALYQHADVATWPPKSRTGVEPGDWWRTSLVYLVNYGPRRDDWLFVPMSNFDFDSGEFCYVAKKTGKLHELILNEAMRAHFELFPIDARKYMFYPTLAHKQLYEQWHKIQRAAGVTGANGSAIGFHDLRAHASQRYHKHAPGTAQMLLGHALPDQRTRVTQEYYIGKAWLEPLFEATRTLPQPAAFKPLTEAYVARQKRLKSENPNQRKLFDMDN